MVWFEAAKTGKQRKNSSGRSVRVKSLICTSVAPSNSQQSVSGLQGSVWNPCHNGWATNWLQRQYIPLNPVVHLGTRDHCGTQSRKIGSCSLSYLQLWKSAKILKNRHLFIDSTPFTPSTFTILIYQKCGMCWNTCGLMFWPQTYLKNANKRAKYTRFISL